MKDYSVDKSSKSGWDKTPSPRKQSTVTAKGQDGQLNIHLGFGNIAEEAQAAYIERAHQSISPPRVKKEMLDKDVFSHHNKQRMEDSLERSVKKR